MSYGDGGFYFLQPVNNGYGAILEGKKYGQYQTYYQKGAPGSIKERKDDLAELKKHLKKYKALLKGLKKSITHQKMKIKQYTAMDASGTAHAKQLKSHRKALALLQGKLKGLRSAIRKMQKNLEIAKKREVKATTVRSLPFSALGPGWIPDEFKPSRPSQHIAPVEMPSYQPGDEGAPETLKEIWAEEALVTEGDPALDIPPADEIISDAPIAPAVPESFYDRNRDMIMMGTAGLGVVALIMLLKK